MNTMQANLGLMQGQGAPAQSVTPSPAQAAMALSEQALTAQSMASQQIQTASQFIGASPSTASIAQQIGGHLSTGQYSQQYAGLPGIDMGGVGGGYGSMGGGFGGMGGYASPSPLLVSPPQMGGYGYATSPLSQAPVPRMPPMSVISTPFTPQPPSAPMFQSAWEQEIRNREQRADMLYSAAAQTPRIAGQTAGYGIGAGLGASIGSRFGGVSAVVGALGGAAAAHFSGAAPAMGNAAMFPFAGGRQDREMGASIQNMSRSWVLGGSNVGPLGPGLSKSHSIDLAGEVRGLAGSSSFKSETGGMFNQMDLMNILKQGGQSGLMDQSQDVQAIKQNLRTTARTIKEFMQLTQDPDVSNVIRTMSQMGTQLGMDQMQMREAASGMRTYSRAAGASIEAIQSSGGMAGAATFAGAGLGAGTGYNYGMYSLASARQGVAAGSMTPRQLQMLGGVEGVAGRNMQIGASMMSNEALGLAVSMRTGGDWALDKEALGDLSSPGAMGLKSLRKRAKKQFKGASMSEMAMYPLRQRELMSQAVDQLSPQEMMAMQYRMAIDTGREEGLQGKAALGFGARRLFGDDAAIQMMELGGSTEFWDMQKKSLNQSIQERSMEDYKKTQDAAPGYWGRLGGMVSRSAGGRRLSEVGTTTSQAFGQDIDTLGGFFSGIGSGVSNFFEDRAAAEEGRYIRRRDDIQVTHSASERAFLQRNAGKIMKRGAQLTGSEKTDFAASDVNYRGKDMMYAYGLMANKTGAAYERTAAGKGGVDWRYAGNMVSDAMSMAGGLASYFGADQGIVETMAGNSLEFGMDSGLNKFIYGDKVEKLFGKDKMIDFARSESRTMSKVFGGMERYKSKEGRARGKSELAKALGVSETDVESIVEKGAAALGADYTVKRGGTGDGGAWLTEDFRNYAMQGMQGAGTSIGKFEGLSEENKAKLYGMIGEIGAQGSGEAEKQMRGQMTKQFKDASGFLKAEEDAFGDLSLEERKKTLAGQRGSLFGIRERGGGLTKAQQKTLGGITEGITEEKARALSAYMRGGSGFDDTRARWIKDKKSDAGFGEFWESVREQGRGLTEEQREVFSLMNRGATKSDTQRDQLFANLAVTGQYTKTQAGFESLLRPVSGISESAKKGNIAQWDDLGLEGKSKEDIDKMIASGGAGKIIGLQANLVKAGLQTKEAAYRRISGLAGAESVAIEEDIALTAAPTEKESKAKSALGNIADTLTGLLGGGAAPGSGKSFNDSAVIFNKSVKAFGVATEKITAKLEETK